jgi:toxin ParE1/3/4
MNNQVRLNAQAKQDLRDVWRGLAEFSGLEPADNRLKTINQKFQQIVQFPHSGSSREDLLPGLRSLPVEDFLIFYRIGHPLIEIVRVVHGRRDIDAIFSEEQN